MASLDRSKNDILREIPSVKAILEHPDLLKTRDEFGPVRLTRIVRDVLGEVRAEVLAGRVLETSQAGLVTRVSDRIEQPRSGLREVINATGILLHTGLGRAPLAEDAVMAASRVSHGYCNLELDLESGQRGRRTTHVESLLKELTGAAAATVVNNNAAATVLALRALAAGGEVLVSRGELVEIGGSYRLPEIFEVSGARLREVGTTNKTRISDFERAIRAETKAILRVHASNYRIIGFTEAASLDELSGLAKQRGLFLIDDIGSGSLCAGQLPTSIDDPTASAAVQAGADLVLFSGDKLLGGPQCGIAVGTESAVRRLESDPLMRAFRVDKLILAALETTLRLILDGLGNQKVPLWAMLNTSVDRLQSRAETLANQLRMDYGLCADAIASEAYLGGGSMPGQAISSFAVRISPPFPENVSEEAWARSLRLSHPAIVARIQRGSVWFDLRTVPDDADELLLKTVGRGVRNRE